MILFQITTGLLQIHIMKTSKKAMSLERIARGPTSHSAFSMTILYNYLWKICEGEVPMLLLYSINDGEKDLLLI